MGETDRTEWDHPKSDANLKLRGIDFAGLDQAFDGRFALVREDKRREQRFNMLVELNGILLNVTFTPRGERQRIISARPANRTERRIYHGQRQNP